MAGAPLTASAGVDITRVDPAFWYAGMEDSSLQLMVYARGIGGAEGLSVETDYPGLSVDSVVKAHSPNYLLVYLGTEGAQPGRATIRFKGGGVDRKLQYTLKKRDMPGAGRTGFSNADVLYLLMPDRFANGDTSNDQIKGMNTYKADRSQPSLRHGGDLEGIRRRLGYFNELGVTALWFTPVLENNSPDDPVGYSTYHGYATTDYYRVDPRFGTNAEYRSLVDEAHSKGLKVVMDMIFNHCGFEHPWVADMPMADWLNTPEWLADSTGGKTKYLQTSYKLTPVMDPYASEIDTRETVDGWFVPTMPDLNQRNPHVLKYLIQNSIWWIETAGIDGIRMDTYPYADRAAMAKWMEALQREYPNFNTVGETWVTEPAYTAAWQKGSKLSATDSHLKTVMDFSFYDKVNMAKGEETDAWWGGFNRVYNSFVYDYLYENPSNVLAFIENHDTDRYLGEGCDTAALKQALALLLTANRTPQLYYGTEILMNGTKAETDGNVRKDFPGGFPGDTADCFTAAGRTAGQEAMFRWLSRLLHWRQGSKAVTRGRQTQFIPYRGVYAIARRHGGEKVLTVVNGTSAEATLHTARYAEVLQGAKHAVDILTGEAYHMSGDIKLPPRATLVLEIKGD